MLFFYTKNIPFLLTLHKNYISTSMTEEEKQRIKESYKDIPSSELILKIISLVGKLIVVVLKHCLSLFLKGVIWCIERCIDGWHSLVRFWQSNDTQEKKARLIAATKRGWGKCVEWSIVAWNYTSKYSVIGAKYAWKYICIGAKLFVKYLFITLAGIWHGILWTLKTCKDLIIHSKPTFIRLGKGIKRKSIDLWHWLIGACRAIKLGHIRRRRAWKEFRRKTTFKGMLIAMAKSITNGITSYMEEEQTESDPEAITEDDIIAEGLEERNSKADKIGKKFFQGVKDIVEEKG